MEFSDDSPFVPEFDSQSAKPLDIDDVIGAEDELQELRKKQESVRTFSKRSKNGNNVAATRAASLKKRNVVPDEEEDVDFDREEEARTISAEREKARLKEIDDYELEEEVVPRERSDEQPASESNIDTADATPAAGETSEEVETTQNFKEVEESGAEVAGESENETETAVTLDVEASDENPDENGTENVQDQTATQEFNQVDHAPTLSDDERTKRDALKAKKAKFLQDFALHKERPTKVRENKSPNKPERKKKPAGERRKKEREPEEDLLERMKAQASAYADMNDEDSDADQKATPKKMEKSKEPSENMEPSQSGIEPETENNAEDEFADVWLEKQSKKKKSKRTKALEAMADMKPTKKKEKKERKKRKKKTEDEKREETEKKLLELHSETAKLIREMPLELPQQVPKVTHSISGLLEKIKEREKTITLLKASDVQRLTKRKYPKLKVPLVVGDDDFLSVLPPDPEEQVDADDYDEMDEEDEEMIDEDEYIDEENYNSGEEDEYELEFGDVAIGIIDEAKIAQVQNALRNDEMRMPIENTQDLQGGTLDIVMHEPMERTLPSLHLQSLAMDTQTPEEESKEDSESVAPQPKFASLHLNYSQSQLANEVVDEAEPKNVADAANASDKESTGEKEAEEAEDNEESEESESEVDEQELQATRKRKLEEAIELHRAKQRKLNMKKRPRRWVDEEAEVSGEEGSADEREDGIDEYEEDLLAYDEVDNDDPAARHKAFDEDGEEEADVKQLMENIVSGKWRKKFKRRQGFEDGESDSDEDYASRRNAKGYVSREDDKENFNFLNFYRDSMKQTLGSAMDDSDDDSAALRRSMTRKVSISDASASSSQSQTSVLDDEQSQEVMRMIKKTNVFEAQTATPVEKPKQMIRGRSFVNRNPAKLNELANSFKPKAGATHFIFGGGGSQPASAEDKTKPRKKSTSTASSQKLPSLTSSASSQPPASRQFSSFLNQNKFT
eukprot:TRINITY_DN4974_c0_g1_i1.p1 TRINITY_DN4974_c0_g1~~TRINITY_DN4974_c0_g1_i1.p1  ORF type:complete len:967 (+),score=397.30 TRINITY_DN4974_c0_g1_i1:150-3050(+)